MAGMRKGQFYIITAFMILVIIAGVSVVYSPLFHRTETSIRKAGPVKNTFEEIINEFVYAARMGPNNSSLLNDFKGYTEWYAEGKGMNANITYTVEGYKGNCDALYNCAGSDCTNATVINVKVWDNVVFIEGNKSVCWK